LYQKPRDEEQDRLFHKSLHGLKEMYAHQQTWVICFTPLPPDQWLPPNAKPYTERGWPCFEMAISSWITDPLKLLDLSKLMPDGAPRSSIVDVLDAALNSGSWHDVHMKCIAERPQPLSPAKFEKRLESTTFTNGSDKTIVSRLYQEIFVEVFSEVEELDFSGLGWTDIDELIDTLSDASTACPQLKTIWLFDNNIHNRLDAAHRLQQVVGDTVSIFGLEVEDTLLEESVEGARFHRKPSLDAPTQELSLAE